MATLIKHNRMANTMKTQKNQMATEQQNQNFNMHSPLFFMCLCNTSNILHFDETLPLCLQNKHEHFFAVVFISILYHLFYSSCVNISKNIHSIHSNGVINWSIWYMHVFVLLFDQTYPNKSEIDLFGPFSCVRSKEKGKMGETRPPLAKTLK